MTKVKSWSLVWCLGKVLIEIQQAVAFFKFWIIALESYFKKHFVSLPCKHTYYPSCLNFIVMVWKFHCTVSKVISHWMLRIISIPDIGSTKKSTRNSTTWIVNLSPSHHYKTSIWAPLAIRTWHFVVWFSLHPKCLAHFSLMKLQMLLELTRIEVFYFLTVPSTFIVWNPSLPCRACIEMRMSS